jgi:hypothetical protein
MSGETDIRKIIEVEVREKNELELLREVARAAQEYYDVHWSRVESSSYEIAAAVKLLSLLHEWRTLPDSLTKLAGKYSGPAWEAVLEEIEKNREEVE